MSRAPLLRKTPGLACSVSPVLARRLQPILPIGRISKLVNKLFLQMVGELHDATQIVFIAINVIEPKQEGILWVALDGNDRPNAAEVVWLQADDEKFLRVKIDEFLPVENSQGAFRICSTNLYDAVKVPTNLSGNWRSIDFLQTADAARKGS